MSAAKKNEASENRVLAKFWPDEFTLMGPPSVVLDIEEAATNLAESGFMRSWIVAKIRDALKAGETFQHVKRVGAGWKGRDDGVKAEYRIATRDEVVNFAETQKHAEISGHAITKRAQEKSYLVHYLDSNDSRAKYDALPKQAKMILDIFNESGRDTLTEAAIEVLLTEQAVRLKSKQKPMQVFGYYRSMLVRDGLLEPEA